MSWVPCPKCQGKQPARDTCAECHGNGGAFAMPPEPVKPPTREPEPAPDKVVRRG